MATAIEASKAVINFIVQTGGSLVQGVKSIVVFNYQLVRAVIHAVQECVHVVATVANSLTSAVAEICYCIGDFLGEVVNVFCACGRAACKLLWVCYHIIALVCCGIGEVFQWIILVVDGAFKWVSSTFFTTGEYLFVSSSSSREYVSNTVNTGVESLAEVAHQSAKLSSNAMTSLCYQISQNITAGVTSIGESVMFVFKGIMVFMQIVGRVITQLVTAGCKRLADLFTIQTTIPSDMYIKVLLIFISILLVAYLRIFIPYLYKRGLTFPFRSYSRQRLRVNGNWQLGDGIYSDVSSDEDDDDEEEEEEENITDVEPDEEEEEFQDISQDPTDSSDDETLDSTAEEFEVADSDSDSSDASDATSIVVQLPQGAGRYDLRQRANSPGPSGGDLETILENERERRICVVCQDEPKTVLVLPCKHMCLCVNCAHAIANARPHVRRVCPLCRTRITEVMDVYV